VKLFYINASLGACLTIVLVIVDYLRKYNTDVFQRRLFLSVLTAALLAVAFDFANRILGGNPGMLVHVGLYVVLSVFLIAQNITFYMSFVFIDYFAHKNEERSKKILRVFAVLMAVYIISVLANIPLRFYFFISNDNYYTPANLYIVRLIISYFPLVLSFSQLFLSAGRFKQAQIVSIVFFGILTALGAGLDIALKEGSLIWPCFAAALLYFYFFIIQNDSKLDSLTGLGNRASFNEFMEKLGAGAKAESYSIVMIDMDHFKEINDTMGHLEGDNALRDMAFIIKGCVRDSDFAARYGGDEFILAAKSEYNIERLLERDILAIDNQNGKGKRPYKLQMSFGWDTYNPGGTISIDEFLAHIDKLMYENKMAKREKKR
jgi:diguanylate cyclase (GGDEF)-like protein